MADRYWVGGSGTWDNSSTANWAATTGGASGASAPTNADNAFFDTNSGTAATVTVAATAVSLNTTVNKSDINLSLSGSPTLCTAAGTFTFTAGTLTLNNNTLSTGIFSSSNSNTRAISFGSGNIELTSVTAAATILVSTGIIGFSWTGTGGFTRNQAATASIGWGTLSGGTFARAVNFTVTAGASQLTINSGSYINNLIFTGSTCTVNSSNVNIAGNLTLATGGTYTSLAITFINTSTVTSSGTTLGNTTINAVTVTLADALTSSSPLTVTAGTFTTNNFNVTATQLISNNSNTRTINLGSSTVTLSSTTPVNFLTSTGLTFNAGTSSIVCSATGPSVTGGGLAFYDIQYTSTAIGAAALDNVSSARNITIAGRTSAGVSAFVITANTTISGTLTLSAGINATARTFVRSDTIGATRTLTCAAVAAPTDIDFRDITIAGAAAPVSGTRLGDCKGNSGITFGAGASKYWRAAISTNWATGGANWSLTDGGTGDVNYFPLAQDTCIFQTYPNSGQPSIINANYNIGTIDMSARTSNTMTLAIGTQQPQIYGNWINGTGTTLTGLGTMTFAGRSSQTITSAGVTFTPSLVVNAFGGSVVLLDALTSNRSISSALTLSSGTFDANGHNVSLVGAAGGFTGSNNTDQKTIAIGSGTWVIAGSGSCWNITNSSNLTVTGTGTISLTSASAKTFTGVNIQTWPTLNQGGTGTLTVVDSNKFINITNSAIGSVQFTGATTNEFNAFNLNGVSGNLLAVGSTNTNQATLRKSSAWLMGANSTNGGNNTGLSFTAGGGIDYLSVSYINGVVVSTVSGNMFMMFFP